MSIDNQLPPITVPEIPLAQFVLQHALQLGAKAALIDGASGRTLSYAQLWTQLRHVAKSLVQRGYRKGDVFALYSPNLPEYAVAFHALTTLGGVVMPVNPRCTPHELSGQLNETQAKCLLTVGACLNHALQVVEQTALREIFTFDSAPHAKHFAELCESILQENEVPTDALIEPRHDLAVWPGAADGPQNETQTHHSLAHSLLQFANSEAAHSPNPRAVFLGVAPFHQPASLLLLNYALYQGATVVTMPRFELRAFLHTLQKYRVTHAALLSPWVELLATDALVEKYDLSTLQTLYVTDAALAEMGAQRCAARLHCRVKQVGKLGNVSRATAES
ncbi:MAG: AMP-binding protein [Acidobacteria bacterium]|nr:AMP-binding protein [Acidobacteriota bacterium]MBI3426253.1 AMP-binding protein [Acidobacteriota bacterium]